jgi:uncharacterized protein (TIGR02147 family)
MRDRAPEETPEPPEIAHFTDYRAFIRARYAFLKATRPGFSYRSFARRAGFSSGSFLKLVADGQRNLSQDSIDRVAKGLGLDRREAEVFEALVLFGQVSTAAARSRQYDRLAKLVDHDPLAQLERAHYEAYSSWYPFVIRELAGRPDFQEDPEWIGRRLCPRVRPAAVKRAVEQLQRLGLLARDDEGRLRPSTRTLSTGAEVSSLSVVNFHKRMLELATGALDRLPRDRRNVTGVTVTLNPKQYARVVELISELRREILRIEAESPNPPHPADGPFEVHQVQLTLFPVTQEP